MQRHTINAFPSLSKAPASPHLLGLIPSPRGLKSTSFYLSPDSCSDITRAVYETQAVGWPFWRACKLWLGIVTHVALRLEPGHFCVIWAPECCQHSLSLPGSKRAFSLTSPPAASVMGARPLSQPAPPVGPVVGDTGQGRLQPGKTRRKVTPSGGSRVTPNPKLGTVTQWGDCRFSSLPEYPARRIVLLIRLTWGKCVRKDANEKENTHTHTHARAHTHSKQPSDFKEEILTQQNKSFLLFLCWSLGLGSSFLCNNVSFMISWRA